MNSVSLQALKKHVVYDSTNLNIINRKNTYEYFKEANPNINIIAIILDYAVEYSKKMSQNRSNREVVTDNLIDFLQSYYKELIEGIDCDISIKVSLDKKGIISLKLLVMDIIRIIKL